MTESNRNWIKAGLALSHIKTALHSLKHTHPVQKIYLGQTMTQSKYRQQMVKNDPKLSSKSNFNGISFEKSIDDEFILCICVFHDALPSLVDKSVIMAETLKQKFDLLNDSNDRRCVAYYNKRRIESTNSLHRGKHIFIAHQHQKTYLCEQSSPCQHQAIIIACLISDDKEALCNAVIKGKEIQIMKENSILDLMYNRICESFYSNSFNIILQILDSSVRKYVECSFVKWYGLIINNCEHFESRCLVGKDDKFQDQSLIDSLKNTLSNVPREGSQASISSPWKDFIPRESVEWNFFKRLCNHLTQRFLNEVCTKSDLWELWIESEQDYPPQCLVRVLSEHKSMRDSVANVILLHRKITFKSHVGADVLEDQDTKVFYCYSLQDFGQALSPTSFQQEESPSVLVMWMNALAMITMLQDNFAKLKGGKNLPMTMWDFTGQYAFYTTHRMILKIHAIYFLVSDASEQITSHVFVPCYFNIGEIMNCKVNAKLLEGDECRFEVEELKDTDEIYLRFYAKEVQSRQILQSCIIAIISCAESLPSQSAERFLYLGYPYMENGDLPGNINLENSAKNMCTERQELNFQIWTHCDFLIACAVGYLYNSSVRAPVFHQAATSNSAFLAEYFGMKIGDFGIAVEAIQNTNVANWTAIQEKNDYNLCNMNLVKYNASNIFSVGIYSACYLQTFRGKEWLRLAINGTENNPWLSTLTPKCSKQSISFIVKKLYQTWLDWNVCVENRTDERIKIKETYLHHIFEMCSALLSSNGSHDQDELSHTLQITEDIKNHACNYEMDSMSEDLASIIATLMNMQVSSSLPTDDTGVQQDDGAEDLSGSISWDSIVSLRAPDKHSQKCREKNTVNEIQMVDSLHMSLRDFFERKFTTFVQLEDGNGTEQQIQFGCMQHEQGITDFNEQNVKDIDLKDKKKSAFHSTIWLTLNSLPPPKLSQDVIFFEGQTTNELREILTQLASDNVPETQTMMKFEMLRLCTMKHFPRGNRPFVIRIVGAGFYYGGYNDQVICYCCGSRKDNWVFEDIPLLIHQKMSPRCSFLTKNALVNIPIRKANLPQSTTDVRLLAIQKTDGSVPSDTKQGVLSLMLPSSEQNYMKISNETHETLVTYKGSPPNHLVSSEGQNVMDNQQTSIAIADSVKGPPPKYPQYAVKNMRINSFQGWPADLHQRPEEMAECGFFFAGFSDCVRCFHCGVGLRHWMNEDDPWIEHTRWSASCFYVYKMKGEEFVSLVKMAVEIAEREEAKINNSGANQPPTNNTETSTADTAKKDSENNRVNDSTVSRESTGATCGSAGDDAASNTSPGDADIQKYLLTDAAQSVLDMGYQPKLVQQAIQRILMKNGPHEMTGQIILEAIFEIEEDGSSKSKSKSSSQSAQEKERNETVYGAAEGASSEEVQIDPEQIRREHRELRETTLCKICLDNTISVVFLPCGHLVTCPDCAPAMRKCPICRTLIKGTVKIFFG